MQMCRHFAAGEGEPGRVRGLLGGEVWRRKGVGGWGDALLYFLGTKIPFHATTKMCLCMFTARNYLWSRCLGDKCGGIAPGGAELQFALIAAV